MCVCVCVLGVCGEGRRSVLKENSKDSSTLVETSNSCLKSGLLTWSFQLTQQRCSVCFASYAGFSLGLHSLVSDKVNMRHGNNLTFATHKLLRLFVLSSR
jgi:hypothetical protein